MKFDFLSLWELSLQPNLDDERLQLLVPTRCGKLVRSLEEIEQLSLSKNVKNLIMLMGVPGSGKSTMAKKLKKYCADIGLSSKIVSIDDIISDYFIKNNQPIDFNSDMATLQFNCLQEEFNKSADLYDVIILDGTFLSISERFVVLKAISGYFSNIVGIFLDTNVDALQKAQSERIFKRLSADDFEYYQNLAKLVLQEEKALTVGFDFVYIIHR